MCLSRSQDIKEPNLLTKDLKLSLYCRPESVAMCNPSCNEPTPNNDRNSQRANPSRSFASIVNGVISSKDTSNIHLVAKKVIELSDLELVSVDNSLESVLVKNFMINEIMIWIDIQGLLLCAWGSAALKRVASSFGKFMFFELDHSDNMSIGRLCIATKHKQLIDEEVPVLINGENFIVHVHELSNWSVKIEDELESEDRISDNEQAESHLGYDASTKHETKNSNVMDETDDVTDSEKEINEMKEEEIPQKKNHFDYNSTPLDDSCPSGFEFLKGQSTLKLHGLESHKTSHCSTSFAKYHEKDFKGTPLLHEINHVIEFGGSDFGLEIFASNTTLIFSNMARGLSGGIISIWDPAVFTKENIWCNDNYVIVQGKWLNISHSYFMVNIYGPQDPNAKSTLWSSLLSFAQHHQGRYVLFGDLNEVRVEHERFGTNFSRSEAQVFNKFVADLGLHEMMMGGKSFTWMNKLGTKMSKLDLFLLSEEVLDDNHNLKAIIILDRLWSDHSLILLHTLKTDYDTPQKTIVNRKKEAIALLQDINHKIYSSMASDSKKETRLQLLHEIHNIDRMESMDLFQKARIKWDIEGDKNTKFFHSLIKQNRRRQAIQGIMVDGTWVSNSVQVKEAIFDFYKEKFQSHVPQVSCSNHSSFSRLSEAESNKMERQISSEEIRKAVWDCGSDKAPGPDGFSFQFLKRYWDLFKDDIELFISDFFATARLPLGTNSSFITLIPKVSNPMFIKDYHPISLIGLQYKIIAKIFANRLATVVNSLVSSEQSAFISGRQILDGPLMLSEIMECQFQFGEKWRSWIRECLRSAHTSILINGSPTSEFSIKRGLCQGDPLSPFLFILIMKEWNQVDMDNIIRLLNVFYLAFGLRININKSNVYGIGVSNNDIKGMARITGCSAGSFPFTYIGLPIGLIGATRKHIDDVILLTLSVETSWCNILPRKVNILIWRMRLDRLPYRLNLSKRGVSKSSAVSDLQQHDTLPQLNVPPTLEPTTPTTHVNVEEDNNDQVVDT
ncbi:RNA-directed DNA polymerase, eukaryota, reverse transcriptase zinc-binding domain protein [Tanacetum coccineum]